MVEQNKNPNEEMFSQNSQGANQEFSIQRIYVPNSSFEAPKTPEIFKAKWEPKLNLDLQTKGTLVEGDIHQVVLMITVTTKINEDVAFIAEIHQAGIFTIKGFPESEFRAIVGSLCPNILFPYARENISELVNRGGFPPLYLAPINFDALYRQHQNQNTQTDKTETSH